MEWLTDPQGWIAFLTLLLLEVVLGIDNIVFISILAAKLPRERQQAARLIGLALAMLVRIAMLSFLSWIIRLTTPLFSVFGHGFSGRDLLLLAGGLFLLGKATHEIHDKLEGEEGHASVRVKPSFTAVITQIVLIDIVFSFDSVLTAIGMVEDIGIMISAVVVAIAIMMGFAGAISRFVERHPTIKMLALSFLLLIGFTLVAEALGQHISKGYIYFAMAFSLFVESLNLKMRSSHRESVQLHRAYVPEPEASDRK